MFSFLRNIGTTELIFIILILVLIFGATMMKRLARTSGETVKEMKKIKKEFTDFVSGEDGK